jgi:predicted Zn-dependent protease
MWTEEEIYLIADLACEIARQGRYAEALVLFEGLASAAPDHTYTKCAVAALRLRLGQPKEALLAVGKDAADTSSVRLRLEGWLQLGRRQDAQREFQSIRGRLEPGERRRYALLLENEQLAGSRSDN